MKNVGVLLPMSKTYPKMGKEFLNGLKLTLGDGINFKIEGIGLAADSKVVIDGFQKLVNQEDVHVTTGLLGHFEMKEILEFIEESEEPLIYSDMGATRPVSLEGKKYVWCNSFDLYGSTSKLAEYFLENGLTNVGVSTCYYESGYGFVEAMERVLYDEGKGRFAGHFITPMEPRENEAEIMSEFAKACKADAIFAFHNGIYAQEHAAFLKESQINKMTPLYAGPFTIEDKVLDNFPEIFHGTRCLTTWSEALDLDENKKFISNYNETYGKLPSVFALLGYENGLLIKEFLEKKSKLEETKILGPRGSLRIDSVTRRTKFEHCLLELDFNNGKYEKRVKEKLGKFDYNINTDGNNEVGGWYNAYLCH